MNIRYRIIYILITAFVLYSVLSSGFIYYSISQFSLTDFYKRLEIRAAVMAKVKLDDPNDVNSIKEVGQEYLEILPNQIEYIVPVDGQSAENDSLINTLPKELVPEVVSNGAGKARNGNTFYSGILYETQQNKRFVVVVSAENYFYTHHIAYLRNLLLASLIIGILLIVFLSFVISKSLIRPIKNVVTEVKKIGTENLHHRLGIPAIDDPLSDLRITFNDMLNRLETSFETQKNFISNASHELNTPLTSIIGEADLVLSKEREVEQYKKSLSKILNEAEKLDKKTKALLYLARTGFDGKSQRLEKVRIDQLILDVQENLLEFNHTFKISIDFSLLPENPEKLKIKGNEELLHLALSNIVINACKYSNNNQVYIALGATEDEVHIVIKDSGIGIPENELQYIYDPYFRASNAASYEGYGIGLPLSRNIVRIHNGSLQIKSELNKGTTVQINLPVGNYKL
ncbi:sensor histidine kinase [Jiulongibacter sediminis]|uniref:histidine kinase n=1 Tax=Jiulongibacter sediminis TaxID=1605367 RepID=A0A0P7C669_9BACT|nr:HAMP domain-containing sensor histidine kinase [Jiulongibacter sediminis]KPM49794.1 histidine kinase [Jiulongibacter sediminis]TBX26832.1 histidine kinase [Jiulongibacter sediminis]